MERLSELLALKVGEQLEISEGTTMLRVPSGWVCNQAINEKVGEGITKTTFNACFVPEPMQDCINEVIFDQSFNQPKIEFKPSTESAYDFTKKRSEGFAFVQGYLSSFLKRCETEDFSQQEIITKIKKAFISAYRENSIEGNLEAYHAFGVPIGIEPLPKEMVHSKEWGDLINYLQTEFGVHLEEETAMALWNEVHDYKEHQLGGTYFHGFYVWLEKHLGINPNYDQMEAIVVLCNKIKLF